MRRAVIALVVAIGTIWSGAAQAYICPNPVPYIQLQFCCYGCIVWDIQRFTQQNAQLIGATKNVAQVVQQASLFMSELENDIRLFKQLGDTVVSPRSYVSQFLDQGMGFSAYGNIRTLRGSFESIYGMNGNEVVGYSHSPTAYLSAIGDLGRFQTRSAGYGAAAAAQQSQDVTDLANLAALVASGTDVRTEFQINSRVHEKLVSLAQTRNLLWAQIIGMRARSLAFKNQSDLTSRATAPY